MGGEVQLRVALRRDKRLTATVRRAMFQRMCLPVRVCACLSLRDLSDILESRADDTRGKK